jgi:hypothetical protein
MIDNTLKVVATILTLAVMLFCGTVLAHCQERGTSQYGDQFPDAPEPVKQVDGHWTHDHSADSPRWYQHTFTKKFVAAHVILTGATVFDIEMTQHCQSRGTCVESGGREGRGEMYANNFIAVGVMTAFDVLVQSRHLPKKIGWIAYIAPTYGTILHLKGGFEGVKYY